MSIYKKLNKVQSKVDKVFKNAKIKMGSGSYSAVTHDEVTATIRPHMVEVGVLIVPTIISSSIERVSQKDSYGNEREVNETKVNVAVDFVDIDTESKLTVNYIAHAFDNGDKSCGKAISMAVKYAILKVLSLESSDNEEDRHDYEPPRPKTTPTVSTKPSVSVIDEDQLEKFVAGVTERYTTYSNNKSPLEKSHILDSVLGVRQTSELKRKTIAELTEIGKKLSALIEEEKNKKPSFTLRQ